MIDQFMGFMMMKFDHWSLETEAGLQSNTFNIYTIIYIVSTIVFTRFYQHWTISPHSDEEKQERKCMEMEEKQRTGGYQQNDMDRDQADLTEKLQK